MDTLNPFIHLELLLGISANKGIRPRQQIGVCNFEISKGGGTAFPRKARPLYVKVAVKSEMHKISRWTLSLSLLLENSIQLRYEQKIRATV